VPEPRAIPILCGPTGAGKTAAAVEAAHGRPIEVVSADSRQMIRGFDIGTAKPTPEERAAVPFHLVDVIDPGERYTAFQFIDDATAAIDDILRRGAIPLVVGGTGFYLRALTTGIVEIAEGDLGIRERLEREMAEQGAEALYAHLTRIDPLEAARLHPNNRVRVIRALEIFEVTGRTRSELAVTGRYRKAAHRFAYLCLAPERPELYARIDARVEQMMAAGLLAEVRGLAARIGPEQVRKANVIGYTELLDHAEGRLALDEAVALVKQNHRRYAKRQLTWFRHQADCRFFADRPSLMQELRANLAALQGA